MFLVATLVLSFFLVTSSFITAALISQREFLRGGAANGRALSYLAHQYLGNAYDASTILIPWFAGASAMAGLVNIVPRFMPRYGMSPQWTRAVSPLVLVYAAVAFAIVVLFGANVDAQGGACATGVLVVMPLAAAGVTLAARRAGQRAGAAAFALVTLVFAYTTVDNVLFRPDGTRIASFSIGAVILASLVSRAVRSTDLRTGTWSSTRRRGGSSPKPPGEERCTSSLTADTRATLGSTAERRPSRGRTTASPSTSRWPS